MVCINGIQEFSYNYTPIYDASKIKYFVTVWNVRFASMLVGLLDVCGYFLSPKIDFVALLCNESLAKLTRSLRDSDIDSLSLVATTNHP